MRGMPAGTRWSIQGVSGRWASTLSTTILSGSGESSASGAETMVSRRTPIIRHAHGRTCVNSRRNN